MLLNQRENSELKKLYMFMMVKLWLTFVMASVIIPLL